MLEAHHCDLIVTDMFMRDGDGLSLIRSVRERNADLPIVAISGGGSQGFSPQLALSAAQSMGAHILAKPFLPSALAEQIGAALEARRAS